MWPAPSRRVGRSSPGLSTSMPGSSAISPSGPSARPSPPRSRACMAQKAGVCQDFAHLMIAGLRSLGLPARYTSGYIRTYPLPGRPRRVGADVSHAWVGAWLGEPARLGRSRPDQQSHRPERACRARLGPGIRRCLSLARHHPRRRTTRPLGLGRSRTARATDRGVQHRSCFARASRGAGAGRRAQRHSAPWLQTVPHPCVEVRTMAGPPALPRHGAARGHAAGSDPRAGSRPGTRHVPHSLSAAWAAHRRFRFLARTGRSPISISTTATRAAGPAPWTASRGSRRSAAFRSACGCWPCRSSGDRALGRRLHDIEARWRAARSALMRAAARADLTEDARFDEASLRRNLPTRPSDGLAASLLLESPHEPAPSPSPPQPSHGGRLAALALPLALLAACAEAPQQSAQRAGAI